MFVPYTYRPFWHPNTQSVVHQDVTELTRKLNRAEKKVDEYARLVASLYADLRRYQDIVCHGCRENIARQTHPPNPTEQVQACPTSGIQAAADLSSSINPAALIVATSSPDNPQITLAHRPTTTTPAHPSDANSERSQSALPSIPETPTNAGPTPPNSDHPEWSVEYNPDIEQGLSLYVTKTFTFAHMVYCTKFSRDGKYLALGLQNGEIHIYNMMTGSTRILARRSATVFYTDAPERPSGVWDARFSLDNKYIATGAYDGQINIWEIDRGRLRATFINESFVRCVDFSPNCRFLVSASFDDSVYMWRLRDGSRRALFQPDSLAFMTVAFSPDGRYVAAGNDDGFIWIWDARSYRLVTKCKFAGGDYLRSVVFTPDAKRVASGGRKVQCWDLSSRREIHSGRHVIMGSMNQIFEFEGNKEAITAVSSSFDSRWVVASSRDHNVYILDANSGSWVCTLKAHKDTIWGADWSPAGCYIVSGGDDRCVRLWMYEIVE